MSTYSQLAKLGLFDARVPRYTSYPAAPHFSDAVGPGDKMEWIAAIPAGEKLSLYIHIPFCRHLCWFCACRTQGTTTLSPVQAYVDTLKLELSQIGAALNEGVVLEHLHWGGGTPTLLPVQTISDLAKSIFEQLPLTDNPQFSVEIDPNEIDSARMDALALAGMNRASIGVQDFDPEIQKTIGREQSFEITEYTVKELRARGIQSLNMDILFGLPHQTTRRIAESVHKVVSLSPDRVALFGYAHVPWMAKRQSLIPTGDLPTPEERLYLFEVARDIFVENGYVEIGIDHFARPDDGLAIAQKNKTMQRNFQGYTEDSSAVLIGAGASAISRFPQGYAQNAPSTSAYQATIRGGELSTTRGHRFDTQDRIRGRMIETLMCDFELPYAALADELRISVEEIRTLCDPLRTSFAGMISETQTHLKILPHARPLTRMMARSLDAYGVARNGHSHAI